jgi:hypothetical protein
MSNMMNLGWIISDLIETRLAATKIKIAASYVWNNNKICSKYMPGFFKISKLFDVFFKKMRMENYENLGVH